MRTLKKTLALVLCLAMIAGLCCFGTSAAFADAADIEYTEAVEVMNALGVLKGDGTNFNPKGILTRAEAAVMLAKLIGEGNKEVFRQNMEISRNVMEVLEKARKSAGMSF